MIFIWIVYFIMIITDNHGSSWVMEYQDKTITFYVLNAVPMWPISYINNTYLWIFHSLFQYIHPSNYSCTSALHLHKYLNMCHYVSMDSTCMGWFSPNNFYHCNHSCNYKGSLQTNRYMLHYSYRACVLSRNLWCRKN